MNSKEDKRDSFLRKTNVKLFLQLFIFLKIDNVFYWWRTTEVITSSHVLQVFTFDKRTIESDCVNSSIANPQLLEGKL